jgi:hypothetical protein
MHIKCGTCATNPGNLVLPPPTMARLANTILNPVFTILAFTFSAVEAQVSCWQKSRSFTQECGYRGYIIIAIVFAFCTCTSRLSSPIFTLLICCVSAYQLGIDS